MLRGRWRILTGSRVLVWGLAARAALVWVGVLLDRLPIALDYTDVDYWVLRDAAVLVLSGGSPYDRSTYRYSPCLAWLLLPDAYFGTAWIGKMIFSFADVALALSMEWLLRSRGTPKAETYVVYAWALNPAALNVCTRGSCDALIATLVVSAVRLAEEGAALKAGLLLGLGAHLKLYPSVHVAALVVFYARRRKPRLVARSLVGAAAAFVTCSLLSLAMYGREFWENALLYHLTRRDHRHNFSPYWFSIYLADINGQTALLSLLPLALNAVTLLATTYYLADDLLLCIFAQTLIFVAANKVATAQYFIWWLPLALVLVAPSLSKNKSMFPYVWWLGSLAIWLGVAACLEFYGANLYHALWLATLLFYAANIQLLRSVLRASTPPAASPPNHDHQSGNKKEKKTARRRSTN